MVAAILIALVLLGFYLSWRATRLDRLHHRVETARAALDAALLRRAAAVLDLTADPGLGPETAGRLAEAANAARRAGVGERELTESRLSQALRAALERPDAGPAPDRLEEVTVAARGVYLARVFHNDAVSDTRRARRSRLVRLLRLAGTAALPHYFEMDDQPPRR
ncbi:hypothetical protein [Nocardiopsis sp. B62]|uniref:hypothetical protein n=1 Tax=Nocardiopsis sp. B62 TaxID=2824874 RepID=UPI001B38F06D|nr:hypothetical protein [Nocardiopsis sp. B62]MBQ1083654.1 hypothetical protein [Nocardiopsis sp. B62]